MSRIVVIEGARGTGKSTVARNARQKIPEITLVNPVGFHADGKEGLRKIVQYYASWINFISEMWNHDSTFVFDRFFFTERVFSELYKEYDFTDYYEEFLEELSEIADVDVVFFTIEDEKELKRRLTRDKVPFGKVEESVAETMNQQELYRNIMFDMESNYANIKLHEIDTTSLTPEEVEELVFKIIKGGEK